MSQMRINEVRYMMLLLSRYRKMFCRVFRTEVIEERKTLKPASFQYIEEGVYNYRS